MVGDREPWKKQLVRLAAGAKIALNPLTLELGASVGLTQNRGGLLPSHKPRMRIAILGPKRPMDFGGAATYEVEFFNGLVAGLKTWPHTLIVFSRQERPRNLPSELGIEWVRVKFVPF